MVTIAHAASPLRREVGRWEEVSESAADASLGDTPWRRFRLSGHWVVVWENPSPHAERQGCAVRATQRLGNLRHDECGHGESIELTDQPRHLELVCGCRDDCVERGYGDRAYRPPTGTRPLEIRQSSDLRWVQFRGHWEGGSGMCGERPEHYHPDARPGRILRATQLRDLLRASGDRGERASLDACENALRYSVIAATVACLLALMHASLRSERRDGRAPDASPYRANKAPNDFAPVARSRDWRLYVTCAVVIAAALYAQNASRTFSAQPFVREATPYRELLVRLSD